MAAGSSGSSTTTRSALPEDSQQGAGPPAGWYPDATNGSLERYWDGSAWSKNVRKAAVKHEVPKKQGGGLLGALNLDRDKFKASGRYRLAVFVIGLVIAIVVVGFSYQFFHNVTTDRWTGECTERSDNSYQHNHGKKLQAAIDACVSETKELESVGDSDEDIRGVLDEYGPLDKTK